MKHITGGVTAAKGFEAAGAEARVKYQNRKDMAMVFSRTPCRAAGVFTSNVVKAAPVVWDREIVEKKAAVHAVVANSGIANACTGEQGRQYCRQTAQAAAEALGIPEEFHNLPQNPLPKPPVNDEKYQQIDSRRNHQAYSQRCLCFQGVNAQYDEKNLKQQLYDKYSSHKSLQFYSLRHGLSIPLSFKYSSRTDGTLKT